jgi:hypothetical protein
VRTVVDADAQSIYKLTAEPASEEREAACCKGQCEGDRAWRCRCVAAHQPADGE